MLGELDLIGRLCAATLAGAVIGWERQAQHKPAGLRTHMLVALGAAGFMQAAMQLHLELVQNGHGDNTDLFKVLGGIIGGVGFLGAGSIIRAGGEVSGLTTAATIWLSAALGVACGLGYYLLAVNCVVLGLTIVVLIGFLERRIFLPPAPSPIDPAAASRSGSATQPPI